MTKEIKGVDLARWNDVEDMTQAKAAGVDFAILKVINKSNKVEETYKDNLLRCNMAGIDVIAGYTYSYANTLDKAKKASEAFVKVAGNDIKTMVLDLEDVSMKRLGIAIVDIIRIYEKTAKEAGMEFIIYTGASFYIPELKPYADKIADIPIWWARYPSTSVKTFEYPVPATRYLPNIPNEIIGWQYSSKGTIPGINGYTDLNVWYRDYKADIETNPILVVPVEENPYEEPATSVKIGTTGEGAKWVQWYLWRFGLLLTDNTPDVTKINGIITQETENAIMLSQRRLGLSGKNVDGIVGPITKALYKKTI